MLNGKKSIWRLAPQMPDEARLLAAASGCSPVAAQMMLNRGIGTPEEAHVFLHPSLSDLHDPFLLPDAEQAAERIRQALERREKIYIHGDYDGDGVTSAALWMRLLQKLGADVHVHVPHRKKEGYDMRSAFIARAKEDGAKLIITTDCGIQRYDEVEEAREAGIDVVITDHHEPGEKLPRAVAVVNPHRKDSTYPFPSLAGVGVAFRTGEALVRRLGMPVDSYRRAYIDLAAIGTVTDVMPLMGENRILAKFGLDALKTTKKMGLRVLLGLAGVNLHRINTRDIGFGIGPRINAAGRVDDAKLALDLLLTRDQDEAAKLGSVIEQANVHRKQEQARILAEAIERVAQLDMEATACLVVAGSTWHSGVIGIVANNLVEQYNRPTILFSVDESTGRARGSARSIRPFHMLSAICECSAHLLEFGGHSHAAGMSIDSANLEAFAAAMNRVALERLTPEDLIPAIDADLEIPAEEVTEELLEELSLFEPCGAANGEPIFISRGLKVQGVERIGQEQNHLKLTLCRPDGETVEALRWGWGDRVEEITLGDTVDICYRPERSQYNRGAIQFVLHDMRQSGE